MLCLNMLSLACLMLWSAQSSFDVEGDAWFNHAMAQAPDDSGAASKGEFRVFHEGLGELPEQGYFKKHEPGEIAEFHLFLPDGLDAKKRYPLLIVYHGGKDGASGKGTLRSMAKISTKQHPVIVLSPNMYTMDAYYEMLEIEKLPIDPQRVIVFGFSSGGMGVLSAMKEFAHSEGRFKPATLITASTTASMGRVDYPQVPLVVIAGEKETPEFINNEILKNRRSTCRQYSLAMQEVMQEVRYLEMQGHGHSSGKAEHLAVVKNLIRALPNPQVKLKTSRVPSELESLLAFAQTGDWVFMATELQRLDQDASWASQSSYKTLRSKVVKAMDAAVKDDVKFLSKIGPKSAAWEVLRAFQIYDRIVELPVLFVDTKTGDRLAKSMATIAKMKRWQLELDMRQQYWDIVQDPKSETLQEDLEALYMKAPSTEYGGRRTLEKLLALKG